MKPLMVGACVLGLWATTALPASAAWDNVFQPTLFGRCRQRPTTTANYTPVVVQSSPVVVATPVCNTCNSPPPPAAPASACNTSYTQRCYYQPVTTYQSQSYYEPVTTYRTSYYYEPVASYRYSSYYDACSCSYQQVATPVTSYQLRAQSCPVQSYVQRCAQVPVTAYQKVCYWQPQTTCCTTTQGAPVYAPSAPAMQPAMQPAMPPSVSAGPAAPPSAPPVINTAPSMAPAPATPPNISESRTPGNGTSQPTNPGYDRYYPRPQQLQAPAPTMPPASWQPRQNPAAPTQAPVPPPPPVKLERIVVGPDSHIEGTVVRSDNSPRANTRVLFVDAAVGSRQTVTTNTSGRFDVDLPAGNWLVYLYGPDDIARFHSRIDVGATQSARVMLVNR
jgi:hypothetical protein